MNKYLKIDFSGKIKPIKPINSEFTLCRCYVQGIGKNRNGSYMSKENVEKYLPTLDYCPVVGHIIEATNPETGEKHKYMGGHDYKFDENWNIVDLTVPYGVVVNDSYGFETINEYGIDVEYLTAEIILWTGRYKELKEAIYSENFWFNQSMEINPLQYRQLEEDSNYIELLEWSYSALCLLGKADDKNSPEHTEPCFISSSVIPIEFAKNEFTKEFSEIKKKILFCLENNKQGGKNLDEKILVLQKYGKAVEDLDFSIEEISIEDLNVKMEELYGENKVEPIEPMAFSTTYKQKKEALNNALDPIIVKDNDGNYIEETYFWVVDFDDEYVFVEKSHWTVNDYECKNGRFSYTFDEVSITATISSEFEEMYMVWLTLDEKTKLDEDRTKYEAISIEYSTYKEEHSYSNSDVEILNKYKNEKEKEERTNAENSLFAEYEDEIGGTDEFAELKKNASDYSIENLKKECLCIIGLYARANKKSEKEIKKPEGIKFSLDNEGQAEEEPYGGLMKKYLNK